MQHNTVSFIFKGQVIPILCCPPTQSPLFPQKQDPGWTAGRKKQPNMAYRELLVRMHIAWSRWYWGQFGALQRVKAQVSSCVSPAMVQDATFATIVFKDDSRWLFIITMAQVVVENTCLFSSVETTIHLFVTNKRYILSPLVFDTQTARSGICLIPINDAIVIWSRVQVSVTWLYALWVAFPIHFRYLQSHLMEKKVSLLLLCGFILL